MVVEPAVLARPFEGLVGIVRRVRGPLEIGRAALPVVANRAAHLALLVRARAADEQIEPRVRRERLIAGRGESSAATGLPHSAISSR